MLEASLVVIGDEILGGFIQDTNSSWLAQRLQAHGVPLSRILTVPDELGAVDEALQAELARSRPRVIFTSGGIGSTPDDITFEAVAASLGMGLVEHPEIASRIAMAIDWTAAHGIDVTDEFRWHMMRMARIPAQAELVWRPDGWVPGVRVEVDGGALHPDGATIVILPGVPSEFRALVEDAVEPTLLQDRNTPVVVAELEHLFPESALNLCFVDLMARYPDVKVGSYPGNPMLVRLAGPEAAVAKAMVDLRTYVDQLEASVGGASLRAAWELRLASWLGDGS